MTHHWTERRPLWAQILALTVFVLLLPAVGFFLLNRFGKDLIEAEAKAVKAEAAALAAALEITAVDHTPGSFGQPPQLALNTDLARELLISHTFSKNQNTRVRLYDAEAGLLIDSDRLVDGLLGRTSQGPRGALSGRGYFQGYLKSFVPTLSDYRPYQKQRLQGTEFYPEVVEALADRTPRAGVYSDSQAGRFRVLGAAQISSVQSVLGAVLVDHYETGIEEALIQLNQRLLLAFLLALGITILVSLILAGLIATPVTRLSNAARRLAAKDLSPADFPTFPRRRDEIGDLALALRQMARALIERADASDAFAAEVAHELKNPLTSLRSAAETLGIVKDPAKRDKLLAVLAEDTDRLNRLISDISASSRLDAELAREGAGRTDLIAAIRTFMQGQARVDPDGLGAIALQVHGLDQAWVRSSDTRLVQLVQNLLSNALSFCPNPAAINFVIALVRPGWLRVQVTDQGPGIPEDKLDRIFKRFFTDRTDRLGEFGKHSGLGLSIVQRISESARGRVWAENSEGGGARFCVELPFAPS